MALYFSNLLLMFLLASYGHLHVFHLFGASTPAIRVPLVTKFIYIHLLEHKSTFDLH